MPPRSSHPRPKKRRAARARRTPTPSPESEALEAPVASEFVPKLGKFAVTFRDGKTLLLSEAEVLERAAQAVLQEEKQADSLTKARRGHPGNLGDNPLVEEVGRHSVRRLHDLAVEALECFLSKEPKNLDAETATAIAHHLWRGIELPCRSEIAGEHRTFFPQRYLVPWTAGPEGLPVEQPWEKSLPRFDLAVAKAFETARLVAALASRYGVRERAIDPRLPRGRKALANSIVLHVLAEFGRDFSERSLQEVRRECPAPLPLSPLSPW